MFVKDSMAKNVIKISRRTPVCDALKLITKNNIRHLPVVNAKNKLIGIVTDRDIRSSMPYSMLQGNFQPKEFHLFSNMQVNDIMTHNPKSISASNTIQDALLIIQSEKIGALPVVDDEGTLRGILSVRDLLRAFMNILGINEPGTLIGIIAEEKIGQLKKIVDSITEENISLASILVVQHLENKKRAIFARLLTNNVMKIKKKLTAIGYSLIDPLEWCIDKFPDEKASLKE